MVTNIDMEHLDFYKDMNEIKSAFLAFLNKVPFYGLDIICIDNQNLQSLITYLKRRYMTYGLSKQADLRAENVVYEGFETRFKVLYKGEDLGEVAASLQGSHNVANALAACGVGIELDIPFQTIREAMKTFSCIQRMLEIKWSGDITLIDDYGHHPTEIKATLSAIRKTGKGRVIVAFQPHRYTRTKALMNEFITSFNEADILIVTEIYPASEEKIEGITGMFLSERIRTSGHKHVIFATTKEDARDRILEIARSGDVVVTLGAGDIDNICEKLKEKWKTKAGE